MIPNTMFKELDQPFMVNRIKEPFYIRIQYPVHPFAGNRHTQRIDIRMVKQ